MQWTIQDLPAIECPNCGRTLTPKRTHASTTLPDECRESDAEYEYQCRAGPTCYTYGTRGRYCFRMWVDADSGLPIFHPATPIPQRLEIARVFRSLQKRHALGREHGQVDGRVLGKRPYGKTAEPMRDVWPDST